MRFCAAAAVSISAFLLLHAASLSHAFCVVPLQPGGGCVARIERLAPASRILLPRTAAARSSSSSSSDDGGEAEVEGAEAEEAGDEEEEEEAGGDQGVGDDAVAAYALDDSSDGSVESDWRVERARLEEQHARSIRQRKRRFLPYVDACMWARRMGFSSKEEWDEWIDLGEKRTPYITRDPEKYYGEQGVWRGWDHYLGVTQSGEPFQITTTEEHSEVD